MSRIQRKKYQILREAGWVFDEEYPAAGIIIMRRGDSYATITNDGSVKNGRHLPK